MSSPISRVIMTAFLLVVPALASAQSSDVTFTVPVNLKQVSADITTVAVFCEILSPALVLGRHIGNGGNQRQVQKQVELPVSGGQLATTVSVVVPVTGLDLTVSPDAGTASYTCTLSGFSQSQQSWGTFSPDSPTLSFRLTPAPAALTGTFTWMPEKQR